MEAAAMPDTSESGAAYNVIIAGASSFAGAVVTNA
jgi:hypothetical protein